MPRIEVRSIGTEMADEIAEVFYDAVHDGAPAYTPEERSAWMPERRGGKDWEARIASQSFWGVFDGEKLIGFMSLENGTYVDFAYILAAYQGQGLFPRLYAEVEAAAILAGASSLKTHASLMARRAFEKIGFSVVQAEEVDRGGVKLKRFEMSKTLDR